MVDPVIWKNLPHGFDIYYVNQLIVKTMRKIFSNFVCFSESPNFNEVTSYKIHILEGT